MKKIFNEKEIDSLLFKIKNNGMETIRRIIFPLSKKELNKKLNEISHLSQGNSSVRPSLVTKEGVAYHLNDEDIIKEIKKSKETIHGKGEIKILNKNIEINHDDKFDLKEEDELSVSLQINNKTIDVNQSELNHMILNSLPKSEK